MHSTYIFDSTCAYSVAEVRVIAMAIGHAHTPCSYRILPPPPAQLFSIFFVASVVHVDAWTHS